MGRVRVVLLVLLCVVVVGCVSQEAKNIIKDNAQNTPLFAADAAAGKVTADQYLRWVQADAKNWVLLNNIVTGTAPAPELTPGTGVQP